MFYRVCVLVMLIISAYMDIKSKKVCCRLLMLFTLIWLVGLFIDINFHVTWIEGMPVSSVLGGIFIGIAVIAISKITKNGIGMGDGLLLCVTGLYLGFTENLSLFFTALCLAAILSVFLIIIKKAGRKTKMPFVPFLTLAYLGCMITQVIQ